MVLLPGAHYMFFLDGLEHHLLPRELVLAQQHAPKGTRPDLLNDLKLAQIVPESRLGRELLQDL